MSVDCLQQSLTGIEAMMCSTRQSLSPAIDCIVESGGGKVTQTAALLKVHFLELSPCFIFNFDWSVVGL